LTHMTTKGAGRSMIAVTQPPVMPPPPNEGDVRRKEKRGVYHSAPVRESVSLPDAPQKDSVALVVVMLGPA